MLGVVGKEPTFVGNEGGQCAAPGSSDGDGAAEPRQGKVTVEEADLGRKSGFSCRREEESTQVPGSRQKRGRPE